MKHITPAKLDQLEPLLERLRGIAALTERKRGVFYIRSRAFLHFHEDPAGLFADFRAAGGIDFDRLQVDQPASWDGLVAKVVERVGG